MAAAAAAVGAGKLGAGGDAVAVEVRLPPLSEADPLLAEKKVSAGVRKQLGSFRRINPYEKPNRL
jgi:hypothetical protein